MAYIHADKLNLLSGPAVWGLLTASISVLSVFLLWRAFYGPISHVPGPYIARFTNFWLVKQTLNGRQHLVWKDLHDTYGPIVRIGPNTVLICEPEAFRTVFGPGTNFSKASEYEAFNLLPGLPHIFSVRDVKAHAPLRRRIAKAYAPASIAALEDRFETSLSQFITTLKTIASTKTTIDFAQYVTLFTFDTLGLVGFSRSFDLVREGWDKMGIVDAVQRTTPLLIAFSHTPWLVKIVRSKAFKHLFGQPRGVTYLERYVSSIMRSKSQTSIEARDDDGNEKQPLDMLDHIMQSKNADGSPISNDEVFVEAQLVFFAGADTIASSIRAAIYYLSSHPAARDALRSEIAAFRARGALSSPPLYTETCRMPYLQAVLRESQRICPAASAKFMRCVPPGGATLAGHFLPAGTKVGTNSWVLHHQPALFGHDADDFRPERWLEDPERVKEMARFDFGFGMGARECAGKHVALMEIRKTIVQLIDTFNFKVMSRDKPWKQENFGIVFQRDMPVCISLREDR